MQAPLMDRYRAGAFDYRVLFSFGSSVDEYYGASPLAGLINVGGKLYGTTSSGGDSGCGTVFRITTHGKEKVLHSFSCGSGGAFPAAGLVAANGTLYGTTAGDIIYGSQNGWGLRCWYRLSRKQKRQRECPAQLWL